MLPSDFQAFKRIIAGMGRVYGIEADGVILDAYWLALKSWPLDEFEQAAAHLIGKSQFMPKPADFNALRKAGQQTAGEAWAIVAEYNRRGQYGSRPGGKIDRVIQAMGGYGALASMTTDQMQFRERRFAELWDEIGDAEETRAALPSATARLSGPQPMSAMLGRIGGAR